MDVTGVGSSSGFMGQIGLGAAASMKVMDLAQSAFEENADALLSAIDAMMSGLGQGIDMSV